eukprot:TRINITY_DN37392_c0_g1_i1.p1 TRINITY_DN37392_c0_g1~~TRINITY_DN37392_c0_g1_i1.p1  ORF type:complete len:741 (+),score=138.60 TRINITY_DN37392_c0_g1_i1:114-2336(+)
MGNLPPEQQRAVEDHLAKQDKLVQQLQSVVDQQARALAALADDDDDYDCEEQDHQGEESGDDEFDKVNEYATMAENKEPEPAVDDEESRQPDETYVEPTEEEERNFAATKPWLGAMAPPSGWKKDSALDQEPDIQLQLEHIHGYRSRLCRDNVYWIDADRILYFAAAVGVVHNLANNTQQFFFGHTDDILSIAFHKERKIVATGQQGKTPSICVWDLESRQLLAKLEGYHKRAVVSLAFSACGSKVASVGLDDNHSVAVYDWQAQALVAESKGDTARIINIAFNYTRGADANNEFVTVGSKHIKFWTIAGTQLKAKKGLLGRKGKRQPFVSLAFTDDYTLIGTKSGHIYPFKANKLKRPVQGHNGMIYSLRCINGMVLSGGKDGNLNVWSLDLNKVRVFDMDKHDTADGKNSVRAVDLLGDNVLMGTVTSSIYSANVQNGAVKQLVTGHFGDLKDRKAYGELWGLAPCPTSATYASVGEDRTLRFWDIASRKQLDRIEIGEPALSCCYSPDGGLLAIGFKNGSFGVIDVNQKMEVFRKRDRRRRIPCVKFSPDGKYLAVGSADNVVDIYSVPDFRRCGTGSGASSVILHVDWSKDSKWLQTVSQAYELLFFSGETGKFNPRSRDLKDEKWATQECILGWDVQGIWPKFSDGSDINMVNKSNSGRYLATAEDSGLVKLFNYPCIGSGLDRRGKLKRRPKSHRASAHSSHVTNVVWSKDDRYVLSAGGSDLSVGQWAVVPAR